MIDQDVPGYVRVEYAALMTFYLPFDIQKTSDVIVTFEGESGSTDTLDLGVDYTLVGFSEEVVFTLLAEYVPPEPYGVMFLKRSITKEQPLQIPAGRELPRKPFEWLLDRFVWLIQDESRESERLLTTYDDESGTQTFPAINGRKNKIVIFSESGLMSVMSIPNRYEATRFTRAAYSQVENQEAYADVFGLSDQDINETFLRSFVHQAYEAFHHGDFSDFTYISSIASGASLWDRYVDGGTVAYLVAKLTSANYYSLVRMEKDFYWEEVLSLPTGGIYNFIKPHSNLNVFYYGDFKGHVWGFDKYIGVHTLVSPYSANKLTSEVVTNDSFALYFRYSTDGLSGAMVLSLSPGDPSVPFDLYSGYNITDTVIRAVCKNEWLEGRAVFIGAANDAVFECSDPYNTLWDHIGTFNVSGDRYFIIYAPYYGEFFTYSVVKGSDITITVESSPDLINWTVRNIIHTDLIEAASTFNASTGLSSSGYNGVNDHEMFSDRETGTITLFYNGFKYVIQPDNGYSKTSQGIGGLYILGNGSTLDFGNQYYTKAAAPYLYPVDTMEGDVVLTYNGEPDLIVSPDEEEDVIIDPEV